MPEIAGRIYVPDLPGQTDRDLVVQTIRTGIERSRKLRVDLRSFPEQAMAPMYVGAEDGAGRRYGLMVYPFTTARRGNEEPARARRTQIRFGDPTREQDEANPIARDVAGVDVTLIDRSGPGSDFIVGLDPMIYEDLPMGISVYYSDRHVEAGRRSDWAVWERTKRQAEPGTRVGRALRRLVGLSTSYP
ncbi:MAG: hypothetical protein IPG03_05865 [Candidatus Microthrix sp.]|nr:hypothetical protein [Candidatus Microthrix sp.]MBK6501893.1 hypothetical protein [Candidatus Microthrix sp.]